MSARAAPPALDTSIVVMGVTGCGKTTIGQAIADWLEWPFYDGDDFHPPSNVAKMRKGEPLTDDDRAGWLDTLAQLLRRNEASGQHVVIACSALKSAYRDRLRGAGDAVLDLTFLHLDITPEVALARLTERKGHFMPSSLIASQFETLEPPKHAIVIDANRPIAAVVRSVQKACSSRP